MKKPILFLILLSVLCSVFSLYTAAALSVDEGEFTIATYHSVNSNVVTDPAVAYLMNAVNFTKNNAEQLNTKYVGFLGSLTNGPTTSYQVYVNQQKHTANEFILECLGEAGWNAEWNRLKNAVSVLKSAGIPHGFSTSNTEYPGTGIYRDTLMQMYFPVSEISTPAAELTAFDDCNYYLTFEEDDVAYILFNFEIYPRQSVLDWANDVLRFHSDYRAILVTSSFLNVDRSMFHMWDWNDTTGYSAADIVQQFMSQPDVTTLLKNHNIVWSDKPRDGDQIWNYLIKNNDNIFLIYSSRYNGTYNGKTIQYNVFQNSAGYDVLAVVANNVPSFSLYGVCPVYTTIGNGGRDVSLVFFSAKSYSTVPNSEVDLSLNLKNVPPSRQVIRPKVRIRNLGESAPYIDGYDDGTFRPQNLLTRAEAAAIVARLVNPQESFRGAYTSQYPDVRPDAWYYDYISYLEYYYFFPAEAGTAVFPEEAISRAEFWNLLYLANAFADIGLDPSASDLDDSHPYKEAVQAALRAGAAERFSDGTVRPDGVLTRGKAVRTVNYLVNLDLDKDITVSDGMFRDIGGYEGASAILAACGSTAFSDDGSGISTLGVTETPTEIILENLYVRYIISKSGVKVTGIIDKESGADLRNNATLPQFCYMYTADGKKNMPTQAQMRNNRLNVTFADGAKLDFLVQVRDRYITFEVETPSIPYRYKGLIFAQSELKYSLSAEDSFAIIGYGMTFWTNMNYYPDAKTMRVYADCYRKFGTKGAKYAIIAAPHNEHREIMKLVNKEMVKGDVGVSSIGGPNALDYADNYKNYVIISDSSPAKIDTYLALGAEYPIDLIDFHRGGATFLNGSFRFTKYSSAAEFKTKVADRLHAEGLQLGLHTYAQYIEATDTDLLSDPYWQQQIGVIETFTLASNISSTATTIPTLEDTSAVSLDTNFFAGNTVYLLIDQEIVKYSSVGSNSFKVTRGMCGTTRAAHTAGAEIRHLDGCFGMFAPDHDSELFLQIARNTAKAFNEGGFDMIYLDAIDGTSRHVPADEIWYYDALFVNELLKYCEKDPILEYSAMYPSLWISRTRMGAWDHPKRGYNTWNLLHAISNISFIARYYPTTMGWYHLYPLDNYEGNTNSAYHYTESVDYLGSLCVAYNMGMVFQGTETADSVPAFRRNMTLFKQYDSLRKTNYFSQIIRDKLANGMVKEGKQYALVEKSAGNWAFYEKYYTKTKLYDVNTTGRTELTGVNPFSAQRPVIRIEGHFSSAGANSETLLSLSETADLTSQTLSASFASEKNLKTKRVLKVNVLGNNSGDAICIRLYCNSSDESSYADYVIRLNFEGWREFILAERDNGDFGDLTFSGKSDDSYAFLRAVFQYDRVTGIRIFTSGSCTGVKMSSVVATSQVSNAIKNPTLTYNGNAVIFQTTVGESQYLEYSPQTGSAFLYDQNGNATPVTVVGAVPTFAQGAFTVKLTGTKTVTSIPLRASVTLGFTGEEVTE